MSRVLSAGAVRFTIVSGLIVIAGGLGFISTSSSKAITIVIAGFFGLMVGFGANRRISFGIVSVLAISGLVFVPTTNLPSNDPLRVLIPVGMAALAFIVLLRRPQLPRSPGFWLIAVLLGVMAWHSNDTLDKGATSGLVTSFLIACPLALMGAGMNKRERLILVRAIVLLTVVQVCIEVAEFTILTSPPWGAPISPRTGLPTEPPNELLGGLSSSAQGTMGHPLALGLLLVVAVAILARNAVGWSARWRIVCMGLIFCGTVLNGSRSVVIIVVALTLLTVGGKSLRARAVIGLLLGGSLMALVVDTAYMQAQLRALSASGSYTHRLGAFQSLGRLIGQPSPELWLGNGFGSSPRLFQAGLLQLDGFYAVDNQYISTLAEAGIVGVLLFLTLMVIPLFGRAENWLKLVVAGTAAMSLIFDTMSWYSCLAIMSIFLPMGWSRTEPCADLAHGMSACIVPERSEADMWSGKPACESRNLTLDGTGS